MIYAISSITVGIGCSAGGEFAPVLIYAFIFFRRFPNIAGFIFVCFPARFIVEMLRYDLHYIAE